MKKHYMLFVARYAALLVTMVSFSNAFGQAVPELFYYDFNGSGTSLPNLASAPPVGTATADIVGSMTLGGTGQCGSGAIIGNELNGSTEYVNTYWAPSLSSSWTLSFWTSNVPPSSTLFYIFGDINAGSWRCFTNGVAGPDNWILRGPFTDILIAGGATMAPHLNTWVYDAVAGEVRAYLDGALVNTVAQSPITISGTGPMKVMGYGSNTNMGAGGLMDEFRLYNRALSPAEVLQLISNGGSSTETVSACDSYDWAADSNTYATSGIYSTVVTGSSGCDSTLYLDLTINSTVIGATETVAACDSFVWQVNGMTYNATGIYTENLVAASGCDSIVGLDLTLNASEVWTELVTECDSYTWPIDGNTYTSSGIYVHTITAFPCDTVVTLDLTINASSSSAISETAMDSYTSPAGNTYTTTGMYTDVIPNAAGCDSTITIDLTVFYTGLNELGQENIVLYPNPAFGKVKILGFEQLTGLSRMYMTSLSGARVMDVMEFASEIDVNDLETGIYFLNLEHQGGLITLRFVKN